ncbi:glycosyltransferase [Synechococcus sp. RSCCF101]|uniref:glycosyltransferase n=1 Tax=Synechococcus sp. RSCCF101 TaxID=2511069 RepID=UPI001246B0D2|nr:glycosyltransferase [Synechococcus sp. RSCCF101]QEY31970.1 glycosyltransferase [Synechococcus sp. RSCCF101]
MAATVRDAAKRLIARLRNDKLLDAAQLRWARLDVAVHVQPLLWAELKMKIQATKRNYFPHGISFDQSFRRAITESELLGWSLLYSAEHANGFPREKLLRNYSKVRFGESFGWPTRDDQELYLFDTISGFVDEHGSEWLTQAGSFRGYRELVEWPSEQHTIDLVQRSTDYLARQIKPDGSFFYGRWPCFDRSIETYNTLRHFSSVYSLLEGWDHSRDPAQLDRIRTALCHGLDYFTVKVDRSSATEQRAACRFTVEVNGELKLGATAHAVLALAKYQELTDDRSLETTLRELVQGICMFHELADAGFVHVLNASDLAIKDRFRIIYYDGEALFALVRAYEALADRTLLLIARSVANHFIADDHWKAHDHWLGYGFAALFSHDQDPALLRFGLANIRDHLSFIRHRITTYPTLLELCSATYRLIADADRLPACQSIIDDFPLAEFEEAMHFRARYLANGFFWPELAMFFARPNTIANSFYIRHHAFRSRIDDNEHYISGYCAYASIIDSERRSVLLLNRDLPFAPSGIEYAAMERASILAADPTHQVLFLTWCFSPALRRQQHSHVVNQRLAPDVRVLNFFEWLLGIPVGADQPTDHASAQLPSIVAGTWRRECVEGTSHERWFNPLEDAHLYWVKNDPAHGYDYINYFSSGKKCRREVFGVDGRLLKSEILYPDSGAVLIEHYHRHRDSSLALSIHRAQPVDRQSIGPIIQVLLYESGGAVASVHSSLSPLMAQWLQTVLQREVPDTQPRHLVCDRAQDYVDAIRLLKTIRHAEGSAPGFLSTVCLHSHHLRLDSQGNPTTETKHHVNRLRSGDSPFDAAVCLTHRQRDHLRGVLAPLPLTVVPHCEPRHCTAIQSPSPRRREIVYVARYSPEKHHQAALEIAAQVCERVPDVDFTFHGSGRLRSALVRWVNQHSLDQRIHILGHTSNPASVYQKAALSISTSRQEGFSLGILESLACGCPVLAFDVEYGPQELIREGVNGYLFPPGDVPSFVERLVHLLNHPALLANLQESAASQQGHLTHAPELAVSWKRHFRRLQAASAPTSMRRV